MNLLLHTCCAPCSVYVIDELRSENIEPVVYWYNPNIHPYTEYKARRDCLKQYTESIGVESIFEDNYGLDEFTKNVCCDLKNRCVNYCYRCRLEQTVKYAKKNGYDAFSTTLLVSIYQNHEAIKKIAEELAKKYDIEFVYRDFRLGFRQGQDKARKLGLYMQKYCGCIYSEEAREYSHINADKKENEIKKKKTEKKIRLERYVKGLDFRKFDRDSKEEYDFLYDVYKENLEQEKNNNDYNITEDIKKKLFSNFMKKNSKKIKVILLDNNKIGFFNYERDKKGNNEIEKIYILSKFQNEKINKAIKKENLIENNN